jgi:MFS transporter, SET family, sugar efflux transporter
VIRYWPSDASAPWTEIKSALGFFASVKELLASSIVWRLVWMGAIHAGSTLMGVLLALVFDEASGRGAGDVGLFFGAFVAIEILVMLAVPRLLGVMRRLHIIATGAVFYAVFLGLLPVLAPSPAVWLLILPAAIGGGMLYGLSISYLQDLLGARAGAGASLVTLQRMVSELLAACIFALGAWLGGYHIAAFMGAATVLTGAVMLVWIDRTSRQ